ncbi:putative ATPase [Clarireedia jacksonii]
MSSNDSMSRSQTPESKPHTSAPSSPPEIEGEEAADFDLDLATEEEKKIFEEEEKARIANSKAEERRRKAIAKKRAEHNESKSEREAKARQLDELLSKSAAFGEVLVGKTRVLGRVGSGMDGKALGEHDLTMAEQPKCMVGGKMREYQLEGLTWMYEICIQGMSGILADEMGLGKTIQTISLIALLREKENYLGPHLIIAPLSTLSNWIEEFEKWTPSVPVLLYHGTPAQRKELSRTRMMKHIKGNRPDEKFPVVCTSPEIVLRDHAELSKINWEFIIIDEGHRMKNSESKLFRTLRTFTSATRLLITGTPLQNNLKELWSLLNFLLPTIFTEWEMFESWFDFSDLQDEEGTEDFIADQMKQDLVKKMHLILQPLLLRRVKADVEHMLPKKREYVLYAPMTKEQIDLYNKINDKKADVRKYLEEKVVERLTASAPVKKEAQKPTSSVVKAETKEEESDSEDDKPLAIRSKAQKAAATPAPTSMNAFQRMMAKSSEKKKPGRPRKEKAAAPSPALPVEKGKLGLKRKIMDEALPSPVMKSAKSSRTASPAVSIRSRDSRRRRVYEEADASGEDELSDDEFEQKLAEEYAVKEEAELSNTNGHEDEAAKILELARKEISSKKLGNPIMQLRLVCNSPLNFYNPWSADSGIPLNETLVTSSGKMLLLDRLLPSLFARGHKVLIFSQFKTQLDILEDYARELRKWNVCRIDGSVAQDFRRQQIKEFNENPDFKLFLLSTRAGGQGINLATADTVILFDSDWNPQQDLQAQDRAHRIGQTKPVVVFRLATKGTVEEDLLMSADAKRRLEKLVIKKGGFKTMGQKMDTKEGMSADALRALLLKDGQVYTCREGDEILSEEDLDTLCDRSDAAYVRAEKGLGNKDAFKIVETKAQGLMTGMER